MPKIDDAWAHAAHERPRARCARLIDRVLDLLQGERRSEDASARIERLSWLPADEARSERPLGLPTASGGPARVDRADARIVERVRVTFDALRTRARRTPVHPSSDDKQGHLRAVKARDKRALPLAEEAGSMPVVLLVRGNLAVAEHALGHREAPFDHERRVADPTLESGERPHLLKALAHPGALDPSAAQGQDADTCPVARTGSPAILASAA